MITFKAFIRTLKTYYNIKTYNLLILIDYSSLLLEIRISIFEKIWLHFLIRISSNSFMILYIHVFKVVRPFVPPTVQNIISSNSWLAVKLMQWFFCKFVLETSTSDKYRCDLYLLHSLRFPNLFQHNKKKVLASEFHYVKLWTTFLFFCLFAHQLAIFYQIKRRETK